MSGDDGNDNINARTKFTRLLQDLNGHKQRKGGLAWRDLKVSSLAGPSSVTLWTTSDYLYRPLTWMFSPPVKQHKVILDGLEGLVQPGELLLVLGAPGSGCSTFLRTLSGQTNGLLIDQSSNLHYQDVIAGSGSTRHREAFCAYQAENDFHLPFLSVEETTDFAVSSRLGQGANTKIRAEATDILLNTLGLSKVGETQVGNEFIHGVSGGERRRTSVAELLVNNHHFQAWDNSSRGLDIASAKNIMETIKAMARTTGLSGAVSLYQVSDELFSIFDKVVVLDRGQQIFFGNITRAKEYFVEQGLRCPPNLPVADYLTSITTHNTRDTFAETRLAEKWKSSKDRALLQADIDRFLGKQTQILGDADGTPSRYGLSVTAEIQLCLARAFQSLRANLAAPVSNLIGNMIMSFILGTLFLNLQEDTNSFYGRAVLLFFVSLLNTFLGSFEGVGLWPIRPIVEKQRQYGLCRPVSEAIASMLSDIPNKILLTLFLNMPLYFLANLRRTGAAFMTFYLFTFISLLTGSMMFRTIGAFSRSLNSSIAPGAVFATLNLIYTGFVLPIPQMPVWLGWFRWLNPIAYAFESLMINEFADRSFTCSVFLPSGPGYDAVGPFQKQCSVVGAERGSSTVTGSRYIEDNYDFYPDHLWRNLGIILCLMVVYCLLALLGTHLVRAHQVCGEVPVYLASGVKKRATRHDDIENMFVLPEIIDGELKAFADSPDTQSVAEEYNSASLVWSSLNLSITTNRQTKLLLDDIQGYVKSGGLMALMGPSGAGKTSLLNALADRCSYGRISGTKIVSDAHRGNNIAANVLGYAQQEDIHLPSCTVFESLVFSATLRQSSKYSEEQKLEWVHQVIADLEMEDMVDQVVGVPGRGLGTEQRKRLTIAVELAARPDILLLDEPLSGVDSDTAWSICKLLRRLSKRGYAIICTIHQPSSRLFGMFDQLLYLQEGRTVYCGDIGSNGQTMIQYFEKSGAKPCLPEDNPAEWLFDITAELNDKSDLVDWHETWKTSSEKASMDNIVSTMLEKATSSNPMAQVHIEASCAASFWTQFRMVTGRNLRHDWRTPSYLWSKFFLVAGLALLNGFSLFRAPNSLQGIQNQIFSVFIVMTTFSNIVQIIMPQFVVNRTLYERREQPSKTYSWWVFMLSNIVTEIPAQAFLAVVLFVSWYYPVGFFHNATDSTDLALRGLNVFLALLSYMLFSSTFAQMIVTIMPDAATGINIANLLDSLALIFCGVLVPVSSMPRFWTFMYHVSPATYFVGSIISAGLGGDDIPIQCASKELVNFDPPSGQTCHQYLAPFLQYTGANLINPEAMQSCQLCPASNTSQALSAIGIDFDDRWRNLGISFAYICFNIVVAMLLYWAFRLPKKHNPNKR